LKYFCVDKTLQQRLGIEFPLVVAGRCAQYKGMVAWRVFTFDFEVTVVKNSHLSINGVWAKRINYFREKLFDFLIQETDYELERVVKSS